MEERDPVSLVLASVQGVKNLSTQQWTTADDELALTLRLFLEVTELISGASYPTICVILPVVDRLASPPAAQHDGQPRRASWHPCQTCRGQVWRHLRRRAAVHCHSGGPEIQIGSIGPRRPQPPRRGSDSTVDGDDTFTGQHQRWSRRI